MRLKGGRGSAIICHPYRDVLEPAPTTHADGSGRARPGGTARRRTRPADALLAQAPAAPSGLTVARCRRGWPARRRRWPRCMPRPASCCGGDARALRCAPSGAARRARGDQQVGLEVRTVPRGVRRVPARRGEPRARGRVHRPGLRRPQPRRSAGRSCAPSRRATRATTTRAASSGWRSPTRRSRP